MKKAYVITNPQKDCDFKILTNVREILLKNNVECITNEMRLTSDNSIYSTNPEDIDEDTDCIFVI